MNKLQTIQGFPHESGGYVGNRNLNAYMKYGFVPEEIGPVSNTVAYAYDDWTVGQMALALGKTEKYKYFNNRANNYKNVFDQEVGYVRRKYSDSTWVENFKPLGEDQVAWLGPGLC